MIHADHVVELDSKGQVVKEGEPGTLEDENRSVHEPRETGSAADSHATKLEDPDLVDIEPAPQYPLPAPKSVDSETQRLGDWSVYKYYFSAFGWPKTLVFFALQITLVFCLKFPGKLDCHGNISSKAER